MIDKALLYEEYVVNEKPMHQIAEEHGVAVGTVFNYMKKYGIESRKTFTEKCRMQISQKLKGKGIGRSHTVSKETRERLSELKKGVYTKPSKYGGHRKKRDDGYISVYVPDHPYATKDGHVMEHHLVMEKHIGRYIKPGEVVHHINGIKDDNRIENLALMSFSDHMSLHMRERHRKRREAMAY